MAAGGMAGCGDAVRIGIISDTHVTGDESVEELSRAFSFLRDKGVDAVIHCGDMTDFGYIHQLEAFAEAWKKAMPPGIPLIPVLGNRDMTLTSRFPESRRAAELPKLVASDPDAHVRRILGVDLNGGLRAVSVKGVNVVAVDWGHEPELEKFMAGRRDMCDPSRPFVHVQHPHPGGVFFNSPSPDAATCWLNMFPKAISVSGHSHKPFSDPNTFGAGAFTFIAAGSHYLSGGEQQMGFREVSVLTVGADAMKLDRYSLHDGAADSGGRAFERKRIPASPKSPDSFVFASWNIGAFRYCRGGLTAASKPGHAAEIRRQIAAIDADIVGLAEFRPAFETGGRMARDLFGETYGNSAIGPVCGANCNAIFTRSFPVSGKRCIEYAQRKQQRYFTACEIDIRGVKTTVVQTHLDLVDEPRRSQIARLVEEFGALPNVIIAGDFNVSREDEYAPFAEAGFTMANASSFGNFRTHRRRDTSYTTAIDNVFAKGFEIVDAWSDEDPMFLSDHRILLCRLRPKPAGR
jgi:endonuclease/exonuclease/phosphatase family metal-dependent hydrolase/predicted phosphodiesterase